jgi:transcription regulator MmyB-like protein
VSRQVLSSIARALKLTDTERGHLFQLADEKAPVPLAEHAPLSEGTRHFLDVLDPQPAWVFDRYFAVSAWNHAAAGLLTGITELPAENRNALWMMFHAPLARRLLVDWEAEARRLVALLRAEFATGGLDSGYVAMVSAFRSSSAEFRRLWDSRDVVPFTSSVRRLDHPRVGRLDLMFLRLSLVSDPGRDLIVHLLPPGSPDLPKLRQLAELGRS